MSGFVFDLVFLAGTVSGGLAALVIRAELAAGRRRPANVVDLETYREVRRVRR